jgi:Putative DNA-binding domain
MGGADMSDQTQNPTLLAQQQMLLDGLFDTWTSVQANAILASRQTWPESQYQRGLQAYRSNASLLAQRVLAAAFPTVRRLMGDDQFDGLAVHFWRAQPPIKGDLAQWGEELEGFLRAIPELMQHEAHLPDVAALEWALHAGLTAPDSESSDPVPLVLIESEFPIVDLVNGKEWEEISDIQGQRALVYRQGFKTASISIPKDAQI